MYWKCCLSQKLSDQFPLAVLMRWNCVASSIPVKMETLTPGGELIYIYRPGCLAIFSSSSDACKEDGK